MAKVDNVICKMCVQSYWRTQMSLTRRLSTLLYIFKLICTYQILTWLRNHFLRTHLCWFSTSINYWPNWPFLCIVFSITRLKLPKRKKVNLDHTNHPTTHATVKLRLTTSIVLTATSPPHVLYKTLSLVHSPFII